MPSFEKIDDYINYHNEIKIKKSTTRFVGTAVIFVIVFIIFVHFKVLTTVTTKKVSKVNANSVKTASKLQNNSVKSSTYILQDSDKYKLTDNQLEKLTGYELMMARNEIFARHGYVFKKEPFKSYFEGKSWYAPNVNFKGYDSQLSSVERYNVKEILKYENIKEK